MFDIKRLSSLIALILVLSLITGCGIGGKPADTTKYSMLLSISPEGGGSVKIADNPNGEFTYDDLKAIAEVKNKYSNSFDTGKAMILAAKASPGFIFDSWSGDLTGNADIINVPVKSDINITANFKTITSSTIPPATSQTSSQTTTSTATTVPSAATTPVKDYQLFVAPLLDTTTVAAGGLFHIRCKFQWKNGAPPQSGIPLVIIWDETGTCVAAWTLSREGNVLESYSSSNCYAIDSETIYAMEFNWDLKNQTTGMPVPPGQYLLQFTLAINNNTDRPDSAIASVSPVNITVTGVAASPTTTTTVPGEKPQMRIMSVTTLEKNKVNPGNTMTIQTVIHDEGERPAYNALPMIAILDYDAKKLVATWFLYPDGSIGTDFDASKYQRIEKNRVFNISVTWDTKNTVTGALVPAKGYLVFAAFAEADSEGNMYYSPSSETPLTLLVENQK